MFLRRNTVTVAVSCLSDDDTDDDVVIGSSRRHVTHQSDTGSQSGKTVPSCVVCDNRTYYVVFTFAFPVWQ